MELFQPTIQAVALTPLERARIAQEQIGLALSSMIQRDDDRCDAVYERFALREALDELEALSEQLEQKTQ